jgi:hypothetical protein
LKFSRSVNEKKKTKKEEENNEKRKGKSPLKMLHCVGKWKESIGKFRIRVGILVRERKRGKSVRG